MNVGGGKCPIRDCEDVLKEIAEQEIAKQKSKKKSKNDNNVLDFCKEDESSEESSEDEYSVDCILHEDKKFEHTNLFPLNQYTQLREKFVMAEKWLGFGADLKLTEQELKANKIIMQAKCEDLTEGKHFPRAFKPSQHFFDFVDTLEDSKLFNYIVQMPKGCLLHVHDTAACSTDFIISITYWENLWVCISKCELNISELKFSIDRPWQPGPKNFHWICIENIRKKYGEECVDKYLRGRFTMFPCKKFPDNHIAWIEFHKIFRFLDGLLFFAPVWMEMIYTSLEEAYCDGVQYVEFRTYLPPLYDLRGRTYSRIATSRFTKYAYDAFMVDHPGFIGAKIIYSPLRSVPCETLNDCIQLAFKLHEDYPNFFAGFDLVGQEDIERPLKDIIPQLLDMYGKINFFFHAGETNWNGTDIDENLIDAVLLGTKRIGHGFAICKHPAVLEWIKCRNIPVEICPISNQVLQLCGDFRNHPSANLFADNYPIVIGSDDPGLWRALPLSHDFYVAFLGIASAHADLRMLKQLAINSITYSSMSSCEKTVAFFKWNTQWEKYIEMIINSQCPKEKKFGCEDACD